jgi:ABC-type multidrug transport system ATPase subunit
MSLLELERVGKRHARAARETVTLHDVSLTLEAGELVAIWGRRRSGRSTLLRVAAGIERPDTGTVRFGGRNLAARGGHALGYGIGYCGRALRGDEGRVVLGELVVSQLARGIPVAAAQAEARGALERVGAERCATLALGTLDAAEAVRVMLAGALTLRPSLLVLDEPTKGVDLLDRDAILLLLRSLADEGLGVLMSVGETTALSGADRALSLSEGELHGSVVPELAPVVELHRRASA